jgi:hypothetical protein
MRTVLFVIFFTLAIAAASKEKSDTTKIPVHISGTVSVNLNGIAPVPAFALGKPAIIANASMQKGRFSYDPQIAYGFNFKPWIIDNWFHFNLLNTSRFEIRTGVDISMFFSDFESPDGIKLQGQRYVALELSGKYKISRKSSFELMFWRDNGIDEGTISGYFINLVYDISDINLGKNLLLAINVQAFGIDYTDNNDGIFIAPKLTFSTPALPLILFSQGIVPITANMEPKPEFQWNLGLGFTF